MKQPTKAKQKWATPTAAIWYQAPEDILCTSTQSEDIGEWD